MTTTTGDPHAAPATGESEGRPGPSFEPRSGVAGGGTLPVLTVAETMAVMAAVVTPVISKGVIIRRPKVVAMAEKLDLGKRAVKLMQRLRNKYGTGPVLMRIPIRNQAIILDAEHVHRILNGSPDPFATATDLKQSALSHFEPKGALISHGPERTERRRFNEEILESAEPAHSMAQSFLPTVKEEADHVLARARHRGELTWDDFIDPWFRMVRRVIFGEAARDDKELTDLIAQLRSDANWGFMRPRRHELRDQFLARVSGHLIRSEPGSLASMMSATRMTNVTAPSHQVPQWLFAFDPAGMATFRSLALLASHPDQLQRAREEISTKQGDDRQNLPFLRACVLESLRLWPTTPAVLRQTTQEVEWEEGVMPAKTGIFIFAPFFHRDDERLHFANRFFPDVWLEQQAPENWPLIPFSSGPAVCPGRNLVLLLTSAMLAALLEDRQIRLKSHSSLGPHQPIQGTELNNYALRFEVQG